MMILRSAPASPFARKARIAIELLGLAEQVRIVDTNTRQPDAEFLGQNPLGKIPALILENGDVLYDSRVIVAYLNDLAGGTLVPSGPERFAALTFEALADGIMDAIVLQIYEIRWRAEEKREPAWVAHQAGKVERGLSEAARLVGRFRGVNAGHISLACALGFLDLRFEGAWRRAHPELGDWLADFSDRVPAFARTAYTGP